MVQGFGKKTDCTDDRVLDLDASYAVIKDAAIACGMECARADEILHSGTIDKPMYGQLLGADSVIADLSTYNINAAFELGIRYALRPHATIVVAEELFKPAFDVTHIPIRRYKHLGEDIGCAEARRFQAALSEAIRGILAQAQVDSPVYTFLNDLDPPRTQIAAVETAGAAIESAVQEVARGLAVSPEVPGSGKPSNRWLLDNAKAISVPPKPGSRHCTNACRTTTTSCTGWHWPPKKVSSPTPVRHCWRPRRCCAAYRQAPPTTPRPWVRGARSTSGYGIWTRTQRRWMKASWLIHRVFSSSRMTVTASTASRC